MINKSNLGEMLLSLEYIYNSDDKTYTRYFDSFNDEIVVDFFNEEIRYPKLMKINTNTTTNFSSNENFVVLECVNRLFVKGYRPEHIELERKWTLGHEEKSGRADICITDPLDNTTLLIIECKTYGREFDKAKKDTLKDGAQLFSYWQQEQATKWLVLYTSNFLDGIVDHKALTINCVDDSNIVELAKKDATIKLYANADTTAEKYTAWAETYLLKIHDDLVFSEHSVAYKIGTKPLLKKDLRDFTPEDRIVNSFEEILRHNNVSDKENAFNRLVALFICKLVDEITKTENEEVEFQYKQGTDTYESLQDRLQRLHKDGMEKFMREKIYYVSDDYAENLVKQYTGQKRKNMINDLRDTIKILKYYTNNDFAFKDVHNEDLFYQNGKILVEMVQLFEKYRIVYTSKHQFLGDLFEQLLNKGFKQDEGQFFTPMPITRFIWDCLPVKEMVLSDKTEVYPKVIDYACGAGHFLTEAVETINYFVRSEDNNAWVRDHIFGIEKDYRLARVAKISMFMNGAGESNIMFADGLENCPDKKIENNSFDILVANPPYSVKDFKQHLALKNNDFELIDRIGENGSEIEVLFVERIAQLLKPQGIAAVILPSSILNNDSSSYTGAREVLLKNFYIRAIVSMGSKTFGATGTNTVILYLEKFNEPPKNRDITLDTVESIFNRSDVEDWLDKDIFEAYVCQIETKYDWYIKFLKEELSIEEIISIEYFKMYYDAFMDSSDYKNLTKTKKFSKLTDEEQSKECLLYLYSYIKKIEKEKLYYFALVYGQNTIAIKAPSDNKEQEKFLGYKWSNRKGSEGIQIIKKGGMLYNEDDREDNDTLASTVRQSFNGYIPSISEEYLNIASVVKTCDMLDFSTVNFGKDIVPSGKRRITVDTQYPLKKLSDFATVQKGRSITQDETVPGDYKVVAGGIDYAYTHKEYNREANVITISASGANAGFVNFWSEKIFASDCTTVQSDTLNHTKWLYYYLKSIQSQIFEILQKGAGQPHVYPDDIKLIPVPDIDEKIIDSIVEKCVDVSSNESNVTKQINNINKEINSLFSELDLLSQNSGKRFSLRDRDSFDVAIGSRVLDKQLVENGNIPVYSANVKTPFGNIDKLLIEDFSQDSILWGIDGDWMVGYISKDMPFYPTDHCGYLRVKTDEINPKYLAHILEVEGQKAGFSRTYRASIDRVQGISFYVPSREEQDKVVAEIIKLESMIEKYTEKLDELQNKTNDIVNQFIL